MELADFAGTWRLMRWIEDRRAGLKGQLDGHAHFACDAEGLVQDEGGTLRLGTAPPLHATRRYLWRAGAGGRIEVRFADGRAFHDFVLPGVAPGGTTPRAAHPCGGDLYRVRYDFARWPDWSAEWRVSGPRKDYRMVSHYTRPR